MNCFLIFAFCYFILGKYTPILVSRWKCCCQSLPSNKSASCSAQNRTNEWKINWIDAYILNVNANKTIEKEQFSSVIQTQAQAHLWMSKIMKYSSKSFIFCVQKDKTRNDTEMKLQRKLHLLGEVFICLRLSSSFCLKIATVRCILMRMFESKSSGFRSVYCTVTSNTYRNGKMEAEAVTHTQNSSRFLAVAQSTERSIIQQCRGLHLIGMHTKHRCSLAMPAWKSKHIICTTCHYFLH